jgi:SAM-dependent methyltransferase
MNFREAEHDGWSTRADSYDSYFGPITNQAIGPIVSAFGRVDGREILDVGCGPGHLAAALARHGAAVEGIDFAGSMVAKAKANHPGIRFREADAEALPYAKGSFDHVACAFGVMHFARPDVAIAEAFRVLRSGGRYVFTQWAGNDDVLTIVGSAVARHGAPVPGMPEAPPPMRFSDPAECRRTLEATGFIDVTSDSVELTWSADRAEGLLDLVYAGAVRMAMILEGQTPERRERIHGAILEAVADRRDGDRYTIRRPIVLAAGTKPS